MKSKYLYITLLVLITLFISVDKSFSNGEEQLFKISFKENRQSPLHKDTKCFFDHLNSSYLNSLFDTNKVVSKKKSTSLANQKTTFHPWRLVLLGSGITIGWLGMHIYYTNTWWKNRVHYFKFAEDPWYARNVDKVSHVYTAAVITEGIGMLYEWTGIKPLNALIYGSITAMAYETYIEMYDGISPIWGFDWGDMGANIFGAAYPVAQKLAPFLNNFNFKWSFKPAWIINKTKNTPDLLNDYTSMTFWLSISPKGLLPKKIAQYYPGFLAIALGVSLKNASHETSTALAYRELFLALDYDLTKLPGNTDFLKKLKKILNYYHFPSPAVRISPSGVWYGIYF
jgi:hypothetical protein